MEKQSLGKRVEHVIAKIIGYIFIYVMVVGMLGLGMKVTQWILSMLGVM